MRGYCLRATPAHFRLRLQLPRNAVRIMSYQAFITKDKGRGLRSLKNFSLGDKILDEDPIVFVLMNEARGQRCDNCLELKDHLLRCSSCRFARYCGQTCQKHAWKFHRFECKRLKEVHPRVPTDLVRLMYRILNMRTAKQDMEWYEELVSNVDGIGEERKEEFVAVMAVLGNYAGQEFIESFTSQNIFEMFGKVSSNSFSICDGEMQSIGVGMYSTGCLFNHSCTPNCVAVFNGTQLVVHAVEKIKTGDELTISYVELLQPREVRRQELKSRYCFNCCCQRCLDHEDEKELLMCSFRCVNVNCPGAVPETIGKCNKCGKDRDTSSFSKTLVKRSQDALNEIKSLQNDASVPQKILDICEKTFKKQEPYLHPYHYLMVALVDKALDACIAMTLWKKALEYGLRTLEPYQKLFPKYHPSVGVQLFRIGKLQILLDKLDAGVYSLQRALATLEVTHGHSHPIVYQLREMVGETSEELRQQRTH